MMKKNIYRLQVVFLLVAGLLSATSCNDWLDVKPKTEEEAEELFSTIAVSYTHLTLPTNSLV